MTDKTKRIEPGKIPPVRVRSHPVVWEEGDPTDLEFRWVSDLTFRAINAIRHEIHGGCHYINPCVTVSCREPKAAFFREVLDRQGTWLRTFRRSAGKCGQRLLVKLLGPTARQSSLAGILFIGGEIIPPRDWEAMAHKLLHRDDVPQLTTTRRLVDLATLKATGNPDYLRNVSLAELGSHLAANPGAALYVCPGITVVAPTSSPAFLVEARKRADEWHGKLQHFLGKDKKTLSRDADLTTRLLAYSGALLIDRECYIAGCWPGDHPSKRALSRTPFGRPTVPAEFLGLILQHGRDEPERPIDGPGRG